MKRPEQILCLASILAAMVSLVLHLTENDLAPPLVAGLATGEDQAGSERPPLLAPDVVQANFPPSWRWDPPPAEARAQRAGGDLFTAPFLERDAATGRLCIRPLDADAADEHATFGLSLVEVVREPFRLQLVGYAADGEDWIGVFENRITRQVFLARAPQDVPELNLRIESLAVQRTRTDLPGAGTVAGRVAVARVSDRGDGTTVELSSAIRRVVGRPRARFRHIAAGGTFDACSGGEFAVEGVTFRVAAITDERVQVCRLEQGAPAEHRWLDIATATGTP